MKRLGTLVACCLWAVPVAGQGFVYPQGQSGVGRLQILEGVPVFTAAGTPEQIGAAYGELVGKPARPLLQRVPEFVQQMGFGPVYPFLVKAGKTLINKLPPHHLAELHAAAKVSGIAEDTFIFTNTMPDLHKVNACSTLIVASDRSRIQAPLFGRNFDWPPFLNLHEYTIVSIIKPKGKLAFASINFPTMLGIISGMNEAGLCVTTNAIVRAGDGSPGIDPQGVPLSFLYRRVLEECKTIAEAETLLRTANRSTYAAITICDRNGGAVFEITPKQVQIRRGNQGVCLCTNHFRCDGLAGNMICRRYEQLSALEQAPAKPLGIPDVIQQLDTVNQGRATMHSMVFSPTTQTLHLSIANQGSATKGPYRKLELRKLFAQ